MNLNEIKKLAIEIMVDCCVDEGEPSYFIDHNDLMEVITSNEEMTDDEIVELSELVTEIDLEKLNEELIDEVEAELINIACCRAEYAI